jgi:hypothetical protein
MLELLAKNSIIEISTIAAIMSDYLDKTQDKKEFTVEEIVDVIRSVSVCYLVERLKCSQIDDGNNSFSVKKSFMFQKISQNIDIESLKVSNEKLKELFPSNTIESEDVLDVKINVFTKEQPES